MSITALSPTSDVARYAAAAFAVVLDQHDLPIPAEQVVVTHLYQGTYALYFNAPGQLEAHGLYQGFATAGTVKLGLVHKMNDKGQTLFRCDFRSFDHFEGVKPGLVFTPVLLLRQLVAA